jgi:hypothetical protein
MIHERISMINVTGMDPNLIRFFMIAGPNKLTPLPGVIIHRTGNGQFLVVRALDCGGKITLALEIIDNVLRLAKN